MAQELITSFTDFIPSSVSYGAPRTNARGGKSIKFLDSKKNTLVLSTPLILTWGINKNVDDDTGRISYNMALQFPSDKYANDDTSKFFEDMKELESKVLDDAVTHSKEWFNKSKMSREVAEALFYPILKYPKDKVSGEPDYSRAPTMRVKIPYWEGKFNVELYDTDQKMLFNSSTDLTSTSFESFIPKTSHVVAAIQCNGLWFAGGKFGVTWNLIQAMVRRPIRIQGGCFLNLSSTDKAQVENISRREAEEEASKEVAEELDTMYSTTVASSTNVEDSDEESVEEKVAEPVPAPKKVVRRKRRIVKKKKAEA
jgi:hypothetical protein